MQIVYYSLNGTTEKVARQLASLLDLPLFRIEDVSSRRGFFGYMKSGFESVAKKTPKIRPIEDFEPDGDHLILLSPVWAGSMSSPVRTFCTLHAGRYADFSLILTHQDTKNDYATVQQEIATILGAKPDRFGSFCDKQIHPDDILALGRQFMEDSRS